MSENQSPQNQSEPQPVTVDSSQPFGRTDADVPEAAISEGMSHLSAADALSDDKFDDESDDEFDVDEESAEAAVLTNGDATEEASTAEGILPEKLTEQGLGEADSAAGGAVESVAEESGVEDSAETTSEADLLTTGANRENELLSLIHDLNECNDALLMQVSKLEDDLQQAKAEAVAEVGKASAAVQLAQEKMNRQVSAEQASAQQVSQAAQQQVARLVGELDTAEQGLSRQVLVNENLQTELSEAQARIAQLERECALMADKHAEEVRSRVQAETASRDLRSRLQRQQRYTLQFKAALEKSLSVGVSSTATRASEEARTQAARSVPFTHPSVRQTPSMHQTIGVSMPRSQRIMPWAGDGNNSAAFQGIDPHLEALIRRGGKASVAEAVPEPIPANRKESQTAQTDETIEVVSPEAEARLWQDLERVMTTESEQSESEPVEAVTTKAESTQSAHQSAHQSAQLEPNPSENAPTEEDQTDIAQISEIQVSGVQVSETVNAETAEHGIAKQAATAEQAVEQPIVEKKAPHLNWQAESRQTKLEFDQPMPKQAEPETVEASSEAKLSLELAAKSVDKTANEGAEPEETEQEIAQQVNLNNTALAEALAKAKQKAQLDSAKSEKAVFTEPSPWGNPVGNLGNPSASNQPAAAQAIANQPATAPADYVPAIDDGSPSAVSPVAKPLRPQKKIGSFASVQLPTFPSAKSESFKR